MGQEFGQTAEWNASPRAWIGTCCNSPITSGLSGARSRPQPRCIAPRLRSLRPRLRARGLSNGSSRTIGRIRFWPGCGSARMMGIAPGGDRYRISRPVPRPGYRVGLPHAGPLARNPEHRRGQLRWFRGCRQSWGRSRRRTSAHGTVIRPRRRFSCHHSPLFTLNSCRADPQSIITRDSVASTRQDGFGRRSSYE